ncbi:hypothetical protein HNY73_007333 [Argiope bruennichi]|uniref:Uncharacterized protein n=1 Tax=Argiope bruennichi TaxID=94029 RepID=A0A8T0FKM5_ARGBR|nr:hypothetical protein HNY73_007333 [Argiope bruennichi]
MGGSLGMWLIKCFSTADRYETTSTNKLLACLKEACLTSWYSASPISWFLCDMVKKPVGQNVLTVSDSEYVICGIFVDLSVRRLVKLAGFPRVRDGSFGESCLNRVGDGHLGCQAHPPAGDGPPEMVVEFLQVMGYFNDSCLLNNVRLSCGHDLPSEKYASFLTTNQSTTCCRRAEEDDKLAVVTILQKAGFFYEPLDPSPCKDDLLENSYEDSESMDSEEVEILQTIDHVDLTIE